LAKQKTLKVSIGSIHLLHLHQHLRFHSR